MNKGDFRGFKQVFLFEFMTGIKKTSFKVFLLILCAMAFFVSPILILIGNMHGDKDSGNEKKKKSSIESVYVYDESGRMLFQRSGQLNGYTINTVSIKKGSNVKVYDERGTMKFQR